jgi:hypothetical protein
MEKMGHSFSSFLQAERKAFVETPLGSSQIRESDILHHLDQRPGPTTGDVDARIG